MPRASRITAECFACTLFACALVLCGASAIAQDEPVPEPPPARQPENVRIEFAQVLRAEPVYQTLRATSMVERCDPVSPVRDEAEQSGLSRVVGAVRNALGSGGDGDGGGDEEASAPDDGCRMVPVEREFRRPIGYDVDYVHRGVTYRSRMPYDPGNRVRVRISVTPVVSADD